MDKTDMQEIKDIQNQLHNRGRKFNTIGYVVIVILAIILIIALLSRFGIVNI